MFLIKYLIEDLHIDVNDLTDYKKNCLELMFLFNPGYMEISQYLIENTKYTRVLSFEF